MHNATDVIARWRFVESIHPLFSLAKSRPQVEDVDRGLYGPLEAKDRADLKYEITLLRNNLHYITMTQAHINIEESINDYAYLRNLDRSLEILLQDLEDMIDSNVLQEELQHIIEPKSLTPFPKLIVLWKVVKLQKESMSSNGMPDNASDISEMNDMDNRTESSWSRKYLFTSRERVDRYIQFPKDREELEVLRRTTSQFMMAMEWTSMASVSSVWEADVETQIWEPDKLEDIRNANEFASACTSLFTRMADDTACGTPHIAKLQLSGFKGGQLKMNIGTCEGADWISSIFTELLGKPSDEIFSFGHICSPTPIHNVRGDILHVTFNLEGMWIANGNVDTTPHSWDGGEHSLDYHLTHDTRLTLKQRKLVGALLAASLFKLSDSPWIEQHLGPECIFVPSPKNKLLEQWCPRIHCTLVPRQDTRLLSDKIAALGILILELETNRRADWVDDDEDWQTGERSNRGRLSRILHVWKDDVADDYRRIGDACLNFDNHVLDLDDSDIVTERKELAVIYSHILEPLFECSMSSFGELQPIFEGMLGRSRLLASPIIVPSDITTKIVLFDDDDIAESATDKRSADEFMGELQPFLQTIRSVRDSCKPWELKKRIRIAVLDSGIDDTQPIMDSATRHGRINCQASRSFVHRADSWRQDSYGHGTHVTQLLLKTAPVAEIFIGKICTDKVIEADFMPAITQAINWAVDYCDADIISMSFGFDVEDDDIETAIDKALEKGKLIIAAASNEGGRTGRARPARRDGVMCIHATDGKGNKGKMNPSPLANKSNFATLGVSIPLRWKGADVCKSGTSFAVPIAVGIAAGVLELAQHKCTKLSPHKLRALYQKRGMEEIFRAMATSRDGYDFVFPGRQWAIQAEAVSMIQKIMRKI
ncbi:unnamed protein product [Fusarium graminearum]|uniref:Peptidase S8/S53 domain-containing protein n=1 Tax=Gibberella zeae TaxID=5518 RepID=A0A9N8WZQ8_GIBZA|nr:unnamed protein product [Fusarium graminearum]